MFSNLRSLSRLVLGLFLVSGLLAPVLARRGADDYYPHRSSSRAVVRESFRRSDDSLYGWDAKSGTWRWFSRTELAELTRGFSSHRVYWYGMPGGLVYRLRHELRSGYDDRRGRGYWDDHGRGRGRRGRGRR